eukprot:CAMPEP_0201901098 /NCGR_PEP_ID=MMETSP0902-20130614/53635_1 /ASSEMBLY_ACC=CAM_ASM_000551 /TAXON_ID=420261 /ORGANISM="Thalassiosira antarctica, Strain CCMP982" /LENGTH=160 /DNA_ID=CAMNT_0048434953 /DNA_START=78 /DNA_END=556 /DNA_ORIENTATION=-
MNPAIPSIVALTPWPSPQTAPTRAARYQGSPQHRGMSAAKWSGPAMAWRLPAKTPPVMVAVKAESWRAMLAMGGVKQAAAAAFVRMDEGRAWREVEDACLFRLFVVLLMLMGSLFMVEVGVVNVFDDGREEEEKAWLPSSASIAARMAMDAHDVDVFCLG